MGNVIELFKGDKQMATIYEVANYFLSLDDMTHKKLQKLCYYAQAWFLALYDEPLVDNDFQAWVHGPVCPELYTKYKKYKYNYIPRSEYREHTLDNEITDHLDSVYSTYGEFSGDQLEILTHVEPPWIEARKNFEEWQPSNEPINLNIMKSYYWSIYEPEEN